MKNELEVIQLRIGEVEFQHLAKGETIGFHPNGTEIRVVLDIPFAKMIAGIAAAMNPEPNDRLGRHNPVGRHRDPPEAKEFLPIRHQPRRLP